MTVDGGHQRCSWILCGGKRRLIGSRRSVRRVWSLGLGHNKVVVLATRMAGCIVRPSLVFASGRCVLSMTEWPTPSWLMTALVVGVRSSARDKPGRSHRCSAMTQRNSQRLARHGTKELLICTRLILTCVSIYHKMVATRTFILKPALFRFTSTMDFQCNITLQCYMIFNGPLC